MLLLTPLHNTTHVLSSSSQVRYAEHQLTAQVWSPVVRYTWSLDHSTVAPHRVEADQRRGVATAVLSRVIVRARRLGLSEC